MDDEKNKKTGMRKHIYTLRNGEDDSSTPCQAAVQAPNDDPIRACRIRRLNMQHTHECGHPTHVAALAGGLKAQSDLNDLDSGGRL